MKGHPEEKKMQLTFLQADVPLTKSYEKRSDGTYAGGSYPGTTLFTSHIEDVDSCARFAEALDAHAQMGHCLLTNSLTKVIKNESRAKLSDKNERREWILLDIDGMQGINTVEEFIHKVLPAPFHEVSYVVQYSPSHGIKPGVRAHIYYLLHDSVDPRAVESWLAELNLTNDELSNQVTLSKSALSLSYPLDRVASRNGRIVYITPPACTNFEDPVEERIQCVEKGHDRVSFSFASMLPAEVARKVRERVNQLRADAGLKVSKKENHIKRIDDEGREILDDDLVERGYITGTQEDNERFMRVNINGGDSWAYYFHRDQPDPYLHNFKGEPSIRLSKFDPEFYAEHVVPHFEEILRRRPRPFVFRDRFTDKYYCGTRKESEILEQPMPVGSRDKIEDYFLMHAGVSLPHHIDTWERIFDPSLNSQWLEDDRIFNTWRKTEYQEHELYNGTIPPLCEKIIRHVTGDDEEAFKRFINWLAFIQQNRTKPGTAWVLHGVPGTGKGLLFHYIIRPIFGADYCVSKQLKDLKDRFNGWMEQCLFVNIDEANADDVGYEGREIVNALKNWITEPNISVRHMQATSVNRPSFINFIFTTNDFGVLPIQDGDRRINVAPRQTKTLQITDEEVNSIAAELHAMSAYLLHYKVDEHLARHPMENQAKEDLKAAARSSIEEFFHALHYGDLRFFMEGIHEDSTEYGSLNTFKAAVERWVDDAKNDRVSQITVPELKAAMVVMCRDKGMKSSAFRSMAAKRGFPCQKRREGDDRWHGWRGEWNMTDELKRDLKIHLKAVTDEDLQAKIESEIKGA